MRAWTIPALALIAVIGVGGGVQLGKSAVSEIGPRFDEAGSKSYASLSGYRGPQGQAVSLRTAETEFGPGCIGCRDYPEEYYPRHDASVDADGAASAWTPSEEPPVEYAVYQSGADAEREPGLAQIERYSSYPVTAEQLPETPPAETAAAR